MLRIDDLRLAGIEPEEAGIEHVVARHRAGPLDVAGHPHLRRITVETPSGPVSYPAPAARSAAASRRYGKVPALGEHTARVRAEFMAAPVTAD